MEGMISLRRGRPRRRSQPTAHVMHGLTIACLAGLTIGACQPRVQSDDGEVERGLAAAGNLYARGRYEESADAYVWLERRGVQHADLSFNQGLALAAAGPDRIGHAVLAHERALRLRPRDSETRASLVRLRSDSGAMAASATGFWSSVERSRTWISDLELVWIAGILWNVAILLFFAGRAAIDPAKEAASRRIDRLRHIVLVVLALPVVTIGLRSWQRTYQPAAIVVSAEAEMLSVPGPASPNAPRRPIAPGTLLRVLGEREGYLEVSVGQTAGTWVLASHIEAIDLP